MDYYLDKITCISDVDVAFQFANFLAMCPTSKLWFYHFVEEKVNLDDEDIRDFCQGILMGGIPGSSPKAAFMTADELREEASRQLSELLELSEEESDEETKVEEKALPGEKSLGLRNLDFLPFHLPDEKLTRGYYTRTGSSGQWGLTFTRVEQSLSENNQEPSKNTDPHV